MEGWKLDGIFQSILWYSMFFLNYSQLWHTWYFGIQNLEIYQVGDRADDLIDTLLQETDRHGITFTWLGCIFDTFSSVAGTMKSIDKSFCITSGIWFISCGQIIKIITDQPNFSGEKFIETICKATLVNLLLCSLVHYKCCGVSVGHQGYFSPYYCRKVIFTLRPCYLQPHSSP